MTRASRRSCFGIAAFLLIVVSGCAQSRAAAPQRSTPLPGHSETVACAGTVVADTQPPSWALAGWIHPTVTTWPVPWAIGQPDDAIAYLFARRLVAGKSPRVDGTSNKVLWVVKDPVPSIVQGHPFGRSSPTITVAGGPSIVDVPTAGCWTFELRWGASSHNTSVINLQVLPAGSLPSIPP
jgi:hypothetical protein